MPYQPMKIVAAGLFLVVCVLVIVKGFAWWGYAVVTVGAYFFVRHYQTNFLLGVLVTVCVAFMWGLATNMINSDLLNDAMTQLRALISLSKGTLIQ
jgi:hypothetical protein